MPLKPNAPKPDAGTDAEAEAVAAVIAYHDRTKHHPGRYARGPGGLDWATEPDPFRRFAGAPVFPLPLADRDETPPASALFGAEVVPPQPFTLDSIGLLFELSFGLSARKEVPGASWFLRMNPSSGNLHPTEAYAVFAACAGLPGGAGVYHYAPRAHALEQRAAWTRDRVMGADRFWVGLTSIVWREAWKYGERAFRYCQHDVGHALAALRYAAAALGWRVTWLPRVGDAQIAHLLGLDREDDFRDAERETPELLVGVSTAPSGEQCVPPEADAGARWFGQANRLSRFRVEWPVIDEAVVATERSSGPPRAPATTPAVLWPPPAPPRGHRSAGQLIRQRRSAVDFDGVSDLPFEAFRAILDTTLPRPEAPPWDAWPFAPRLHLVLFVHRVTGVDPGLYLWLRARAELGRLQQAIRTEASWEPVPLSPTAPAAPGPVSLPLYRLLKGDLRDFARAVSCGQDIAADSAFSLGMLARFEPELLEHGAAAYRELFWEAGMIGQALYLAAEAAGVRGTGIGCYLDDVLHQALGLSGHAWQSLYHFTVGTPVEDPRLRTAPPYAQLRPEEGRSDHASDRTSRAT